MKKRTSCKSLDHLNFLRNILLLQLGIEIDIDRRTNLHLNMNIYKFLIEDVQSELQIAPPFRVSAYAFFEFLRITKC